MTAILALLIRLGVPERFAKAVAIGIAVMAALALLAGLKSCYDHRVIENHDARQDAANAKADRTADTHAADQRVADDNRIATETTGLQEAQHAPTPHDRELARQRCIRLQQAARASGGVAPTCR